MQVAFLEKSGQYLYSINCHTFIQNIKKTTFYQEKLGWEFYSIFLSHKLSSKIKERLDMKSLFFQESEIGVTLLPANEMPSFTSTKMTSKQWTEGKNKTKNCKVYNFLHVFKGE